MEVLVEIVELLEVFLLHADPCCEEPRTVIRLREQDLDQDGVGQHVLKGTFVIDGRSVLKDKVEYASAGQCTFITVPSTARVSGVEEWRTWLMMTFRQSMLNLTSSWTRRSVSYSERNSGMQTQTKVVRSGSWN